MAVNPSHKNPCSQEHSPDREASDLVSPPVKYQTQLNSKRPSDENLPIIQLKKETEKSDSEGDPLEKD